MSVPSTRRKMNDVEEAQELIEEPLSKEQLAERYRALCEDPLYANVPGKIELDVWGRLIMTPVNNYRGTLKARLGQRLSALGGAPLINAPVATSIGLFVADVAWARREFMVQHRDEIALTRSPELCAEVISPLKSRKEIREKVDAYLGAGAEEVWIVYTQSERCEFFGKKGLLARSAYPVDLTGLFNKF